MAYSYVQYVGNNSTVTFSVPFPYISKSHVEVRVNNVLKTVGTDYSWSSASAITFVTAPGTGLTVDIRRKSSPNARLVDFQDGSTLTQDILDADSNQNFFLAQEATDAVAANIALDTDGLFDAKSKRIKNVADPVNAQDAVTKIWAETATSSNVAQSTAQAAAASASAAAAQTSANNAAASQTAASGSAATAATQATNASTSATNAASSATAANTSKVAAATSETNAAASAAAAASSSSSASSSATSATNSANSASASASTATTKASDASASATQAANSASGAATSATNAASSASSASASATSAASSASQASTSATNAASSASSALAIYGNTTAMNNAVTSAQNSATSAGTSATNAANSATSASTSASTATTQANTATAKATEAANSASAASASSSSASSSATNAATSATNAASSASQAASSAASAAAIVTGVSSNRPSVRPSLLLDFANTKKLDPRVTFTRATTGTYYDGKTSVKAEENLVTYSEQFDNAGWSKLNALTVTANSTTAPDGSSTADTLIPTNTGSVLRNQTAIAAEAGTTYTFSVWLKCASGTVSSRIRIEDTPSPYGTTSQDVTVTTSWQRFTVTRTGVAATIYAGIVPDVSVGTNAIYAWGAQLEQRSVATAYTPTTSSPITNYIPALQTATYNDARFDHDPVTGESKGLLIEEQRTNLLCYSEDLTNGYWTKANTSVGSLTLSPSGTLTATKLVEDVASGAAHLVYQGYSFSAASYTYSVCLKAGDRSRAHVWLQNNSGSRLGAFFDLSNGTIISTDSGVTSTINPLGNGWYRCTSTLTISAGAGFVGVTLVETGANWFYTGTGFKGIFLWGHQLEAGSFATSYIPTGASQVTRAAETAKVTGTNFSSWFNQAAGTLYADINLTYDYTGAGHSYTRTVALVGADPNTNHIGMYKDSGSGSNAYNSIIYTNGSMQYSAGNMVSVSVGGAVKSAISYSKTDACSAANGVLGTQASAGQIPILQELRLFGEAGYQVQPSGYIKRVAYYPKRLSNTELQGLTS